MPKVNRNTEVDLRIGENLRRLRLARRMTITTLASRVEQVSYQQMQKHERGATIPASRIPAICRALNCSLEQLFDGTVEAYQSTPRRALELAGRIERLPPQVVDALHLMIKATELHK